MAIDNPLDQGLEQLAADNRARSPFVKAILAMTAAIVPGGLGTAVGALKTLSEAMGQDQAEYLVGLVIPEVKRLAEQFDLLQERQQEYLDRDWPGLLLEAERKARVTRAREKVGRLARIVTSAAFADPPVPPDRTEELLRIATNLDDFDVRALKVVVDGQRRGFTPEFGRVNDDAANNYWGHGDSLYHGGQGAVTKQFGESAIATRLGVSEGELQSICAKLQSLGLVIPVERNQFTNFKGTVPYAVLARGFEFVDAIQSHGSPK